jgi:hyperosmotically inducible periplasmic protein
MKTTLFLTMFFAVFAAAQPAQIAQQVTRQLRALPNHGVFDNLNYTVDGAKVTLFGQVTNPDLKASAEKAVEHIAGVSSVDNELHVLPGDLVDDDIRAGVYRALQLAIQPGTAIHIVVDHQNVTLVGSVRTEGEKNLAGIKAHGVPLVASLTNDLIVAG